MSAYSDRVIADGATNYWRLGESAGTTAVDAVGGANGTISGGVTLAQPGAIGGDTAMTFNGTTGKIETAATVAVPQAVTVEAWVKVPAPVSDYSAIFSSRFTAGGISFGIVPPRSLFCYSDGATPAQTNGPAVPADGAWHHVVLVQTGVLTTFYLDAVGATGDPQARGAQVPKVIGIGANVGGSNLWLGSLDDIAIYPRALTAGEIAAHYTVATSSTGGVRTLSLGYWKQRWPAA